MDFSLWLAAGAVRGELGAAFMFEYGFSHDGTRGIARAQEQNIESVFHNDLSFTCLCM